MRLDLRNVGVAIGLGLFVLVCAASFYFLAHDPSTPDVFSGHVYPLISRNMPTVYLTDTEHDLLRICFFGAIACIFVGVALRGVIRDGRRR
ncbi:hypothetical protein [Caulobacter sp. S45]|uniref:hypothetical protein n=1 Tax=Caulobacter sp. S45 TaxID=1641861 RepID=UPI00131ED125|nr:hypothetical protein [Caulobacter sp. S45]